MKTKIPLNIAEVIANDLIFQLGRYCQRIEVAGSIRRRKDMVGDIELLAVPKFMVDMLGTTTSEHMLDYVDWPIFGEVVKNGHKYKQVYLKEGINLDLFIVTPPAQWGVQFVIRTGPAEYSHKFVTPRKYGGMLPSNMNVKDGAIWEGPKLHETPEEIDVYALIGEKFVEPQARI